MTQLLAVGSRSASLVTLALCGAVFGTLGFLIAHRIGPGTRGRARVVPRTIGWLLFAGPVVLTYLSSLDGFYDVVLTPGAIRLRYLVPAFGVTLVSGQRGHVLAVPEYRRGWRLRIVAGDREYLSAKSSRPVCLKSAATRDVAKRFDASTP